MKGDYFPATNAKQQWQQDAEELIARLTAENERLAALVSTDLARERDVLREALDYVVRKTKYDEPHWDGTRLDAAIQNSMERVRSSEKADESKIVDDDDLPF
jgi:hypothetical protein